MRNSASCILDIFCLDVLLIYFIFSFVWLVVFQTGNYWQITTNLPVLECIFYTLAFYVRTPRVLIVCKTQIRWRLQELIRFIACWLSYAFVLLIDSTSLILIILYYSYRQSFLILQMPIKISQTPLMKVLKKVWK